jgi:hypothetical protein
MNSTAAQLVASPTWGRARERHPERVRLRPVRFGDHRSAFADATGALVVLGGSVALWAGVLLAVW